MKATANLENDHVYILRLCDVMEKIAQAGNIDPEHLERVVSLIRNFADGLHHKKEEDLLFPKMAEKGFSPMQGPVAVMLHEHEEGRKYVRGIAGNIELHKSGDMEAAEAIRNNLLGYAGLLKTILQRRTTFSSAWRTMQFPVKSRSFFTPNSSRLKRAWHPAVLSPIISQRWKSLPKSI